MGRLLYISFILLLSIACNTTNKQVIEKSITKLKESYVSKDEAEFLNQFPKEFDSFTNYFGWDEANDKPQELYDVANEYIDYWFDLISKYKKHEKDIINLCKQGIWQPDAVNYLQDKTLAYIKRNKKYALINELSDDEAKSVLFFLFVNNHSYLEDKFVSNLTTAKKKVLDGLVKKDLFNNNKNPDLESSIETFYKISDYVGFEHYIIKDIDINNDKIQDKVVSANPYEGDELLLFINKNDTYEFALKTVNFSEDGGNQIKDIKKDDNGFVVITAFPDRFFFEAHYYISYINDKWVLTHTVYKTQSSNQEDAFLYVCEVKQNIDLSIPELINTLKTIPNEIERDTSCTKEKLQ